MENLIKTGHIQIPFGSLELVLLADGYFTVETWQPVIAPTIPSQLVEKELDRLSLSKKNYQAPIIVMLVKQQNRYILIDTGEGHYDIKNAGNLKRSLYLAGITLEQITDIIITHAHRDHIGGILDSKGLPNYPNATYYISKPEFDFWMSDNPDFSQGKNPELGQSNLALIKKTLQAISPKLLLFEPGDQLFSCIDTELAPGHTAGHIICTVKSEYSVITNLVDLIHSPLLVSQPHWGTLWDINFQRAVDTRIKILERCHREGTLVIASHMPWPGIGFIGKIKNRKQWVWVPKSFISY
ncbi:MBL fold metallo-hydrolase [Sphingobacterium sp. WOUb80]|uniref:MBL fold metallo-hydrolase n=1 Tax=Sphingobacterium sp. WOUb80 TaxID=3234028 RepID=UPI003CF19396